MFSPFNNSLLKQQTVISDTSQKNSHLKIFLRIYQVYPIRKIKLKIYFPKQKTVYFKGIHLLMLHMLKYTKFKDRKKHEHKNGAFGENYKDYKDNQILDCEKFLIFNSLYACLYVPDIILSLQSFCSDFHMSIALETCKHEDLTFDVMSAGEKRKYQFQTLFFIK